LPKTPSFLDFRRRAQAVFDSIPPEFRRGVDGLIIERQAVPDSELPDVYTLGECATGEIDPAGESDVHLRSHVILYYGSFVRLSRLDDEWDWDAEIWETITHEIRHHRETGAGEDALEDVDYAADQNFARHEGLPFDPLFHRAGERVDANVWEVEGEVFAEVEVDQTSFAAMDSVRVTVQGGEVRIPRPAELGDVHFVSVEGTPADGMPLTVVLVRRRSAWQALRALFTRRSPVVLQSSAHALRADSDGTDDGG
jgi:predicted Zn-dependent protease with MMP-like domain